MKRNSFLFILIISLFISSKSYSQTADYYFNGKGTEYWDGGEANLIDGDISTNAYDNDDGNYYQLNSNTCSGTDLGTITKVQIRAYFENDYDASSSYTIAPRFIPYFNGSTAGSNYDYPNGNYDGSAGYPAWGSYVDITSDANAPATWTWSDVQNLECRLVSNRPSYGTLRAYKVEIQVSYCSTSDYAWTGAVNSDWDNAGNWNGGSVPTSTDDVIISSNCVTNWPTLNVNADCRDLTINSGAQLNCSSYNLNVYGDWSNNDGVFNSGTGSVYFKGSSNSTLEMSRSGETILNEGFESGTSGWTLGSATGHTEWRRQSGGNTGSYDCAVYDLYNSSGHDYYTGGANIYVDISRNVDLSNYASATLSYYWKCGNDGDGEPILNFDGTVLNDAMYDNTSWSNETYDLTSYCGNDENLMFFRMFAGPGSGSGTPGLTIDDIVITGTLNVQSFNNIYFEKSDGASVTLLSSISSNNLQVTSGILDLDGYNLTITHNFTNNGTFTSGSGIAKFNGTSTQTISGSSNTSFYDFVKKSAADLVFDGSSTTVTISNSFTWEDNNDEITIDGTTMSVIINDGVLVNVGCKLDVNKGSTISIAKNFQNLGTIDFITESSILKFHSSTDSYVITEPGDIIFSDDFETDPFDASSSWNITNPTGRSEFHWSNGQQHNGTYDLAVMDNLDDDYLYDYQWDDPEDSCLASIDIDLTSYTGAILEFWWRCGGDNPDQAGYDGDYGQVLINDVPITDKLWGQQTYIKHNPVNLAGYCGGTINIKFKFIQDGVSVDGHASSPGFCIDDILIYANCNEPLEVHDLLVNKDSNSTSTIVLCPIDASDDITINKGILDVAGNNISLEGNWTNATGTIFLPRSDTVTFDGSTSKSVDIGSTSFDNLFVNKPNATLNISNNTLDVEKKLYIYSNSTLKSNGENIELAGDWQNAGTYTHDNNTVTFNGVSNITTGGTASENRFYNVKLDGTSATLADNIWLDNDFTITTGTWDVSTSNRVMTVLGDWYTEGTFNERTANVNLRGNNSTVYFNSGTSTTTSNAFEDGFETDKGWTLTGEFERDAPSGLGGSSGNSDPSSAYNGSNVLGVDLTSDGDYEGSLSDRQDNTVSPTIDCSNYSNCHLEFQRWLGVEDNSYDNAYIDISIDDGSTWTNIWANGSSTINESAWGKQDIDISSYVDGESQVKIRFAIGETDGSVQYCGWNIDDLRVYGDKTVSLVGEFYDLTLNKAASSNYAVCSSNFSVTNNLTFTNGGIDLKDKTIDLGTTGMLVNETNDNRTFSTDGSGIPGGTGTIDAERTNPSGNIAGLGCEITPSSAMGSTTISRGHLLHSDIDGAGHASILKYFDISPTNNSGLNATFRFHYFEGELHGQTETKLEQFRSTDVGNTWTNRHGSVNTGSDFVEVTGIDAFSRWTLSGKSFPLPVQLLEFKAVCNDDYVELLWKTESEINNDYFNVLKSIDGINFNDIGVIEGNGNSNKINNYSFIDNNLSNETTYYKLRQTDYDNTTTEYDVISSNCFNNNYNEADFNLYPNPANSSSNVYFGISGYEKDASILVVIYDVLGQQLYSKLIVTDSNGDSVFMFDDLNIFKSGTYIMVASSKDELYRKKLIIN